MHDIVMDHLRVYLSIIKRAKIRVLTSTDVELHHYLPKSIVGDNDRVVKLTYREHFICHLLLAKICEKRYGLHHGYTRKMNMAIHRMVYTVDGRNIRNSRLFALARTAVRNAKIGKAREDMVGKAYFGASLETIQGIKAKISKTRTGMKINYPKTRRSLSNRTPEVFKKISDSRKNTNTKYINMTDEEFETWIKSQQLMTDVKGRKARPNVNVTRALIARKIPLVKYYSIDDFSESWKKKEKNLKLFYGYDIV